MNLEVLPLAVTMLVGPGIMAAIVFLTNPKAVPASVAYVAGFAISTAVGVAIAFGIASLVGDNVSLGSSSDSGSAGTIIQIALVALLAAGAIKNYVRRETIEPPKWLGALQQASPGKALRTGLVIVPIMPSDVVILLTVGFNLEQAGSSYLDGLPFVGLTILVAALPLLVYLLFHHRAERAMPKVRDWMNTHSWLVNIIAFCIFIVLILG